MITIVDKKDCCGCSACTQICAKQCITMQHDEEGFLYPIVNQTSCTNCGLCERVCPILNQEAKTKPAQVYAAKNTNEKIRLKSSSGGIFTLLAEAIILDRGVVFGAKFDKDWNVVHDYTESIEGLVDFQGSKYVQSTIGDTYRQAKDFLRQGRKVLFSGTPCQITGLKHYLRQNYENLITVDVICHGAPSPLVWQTYLQTLSSNGKNTVSKSRKATPEISGIAFRDKATGWKKYGFCVWESSASKADGNSVSVSSIPKKKSVLLYETHRENIFMRGFLADLYLRPSCYACVCKSGKSQSDITLGDLWGAQYIIPEADDDKGISAVLINSSKGEQLWNTLTNYDSKVITYDACVKYNPALIKSVNQHKNHDRFFVMLQQNTKSLAEIVETNIRKSFVEKLVVLIKRIIHKLLSWVRKLA